MLYQMFLSFAASLVAHKFYPQSLRTLFAWRLLLLSCSPVPIILGVITFLVVGFVAVNACLWYYAQKVS
jgi:hypothetical protein